ncbi:MAG: hypothetical protein ACYC2P_10865 [Paludibacteraceae bacterium]
MRQYSEIKSETKIADVIANNPYSVLLLEHFDIKLPVRDLKISQLCTEYKIDETLFVTFANMYNESTSFTELKLNEDNALTIIHFLRASHRYYSEQIYPEIMTLINRMDRLNGHKEMKLVSTFFTNYFKEVTEHLNYENQIFHPYVTLIIQQLKNNNNEKQDENEYSVSKYKAHHNDIEEKLIDLKNLLIKYLPLNQDQNVRRKLLFLLLELEYDLKIHSNIEEYILIPLTTRLEKKLKEIR